MLVMESEHGDIWVGGPRRATTERRRRVGIWKAIGDSLWNTSLRLQVACVFLLLNSSARGLCSTFSDYCALRPRRWREIQILVVIRTFSW